MRIIDVLTSPWAIEPDRLEEITGIYSTHLRGEKIDLAALEARMGQPLANPEQGYEIRDGVAVIPIEGVISKKMNLFSKISGGASTQLIGRDFAEAIEDTDVHAIILHADTPGGSVDGTAELARAIFDARGTKPIYTLADGLMASAGVWIGTAADRVFVASETTMVGSVGVVTQHVDHSEREKKAGIKVTEVYSGKYKRIASTHAPLSEEGRQSIQEKLDYFYSLFVDAVAKHRAASPEDVVDRMADGRMFVGQQAIDAGLVDGVATLDQLIEMLNSDEVHPALSSQTKVSTTIVSEESEADIDVDTEIAELMSRGAENPETTHQEIEMNLSELKKKHPELYQEAIADAAAEARVDGATAERDRIKSVQDQSMPGHEPLIANLMFDGETTGPEAAVAILQDEKDIRKAAAKARANDASDLDDITSSLETDEEKEPSGENLTPAEKMQAEWDGDADLRAEFSDDFDSFEAYAKNRDRTKVLGGKNS